MIASQPTRINANGGRGKGERAAMAKLTVARDRAALLPSGGAVRLVDALLLLRDANGLFDVVTRDSGLRGGPALARRVARLAKFGLQLRRDLHQPLALRGEALGPPATVVVRPPDDDGAQLPRDDSRSGGQPLIGGESTATSTSKTANSPYGRYETAAARTIRHRARFFGGAQREPPPATAAALREALPRLGLPRPALGPAAERARRKGKGRARAKERREGREARDQSYHVCIRSDSSKLSSIFSP